MAQPYISVAEILIDIEKELRELRLWEAASPSQEALASTQPFAIDTLDFPQWLQFIFIPRLYLLIEQKNPLPTSCNVKPMAEQYFQPLKINSGPLLLHIEKIDSILSGDHYGN